jgi:hypothetical protein
MTRAAPFALGVVVGAALALLLTIGLIGAISNVSAWWLA